MTSQQSVSESQSHKISEVTTSKGMKEKRSSAEAERGRRRIVSRRRIISRRG